MSDIGRFERRLVERQAQLRPTDAIEVRGLRGFAHHGVLPQEREDGQPFVVDVRSADEFAQGHIPGAVNIPLLDLPDNQDLLPSDLDRPVLTVCARGNISLPGVLYINSLGYRDAHRITGGLTAWVEKGYQVETT